MGGLSLPLQLYCFEALGRCRDGLLYREALSAGAADVAIQTRLALQKFRKIIGCFDAAAMASKNKIAVFGFERVDDIGGALLRVCIA